MFTTAGSTRRAISARNTPFQPTAVAPYAIAIPTPLEYFASLVADDAHFARTRLLALENTWGGQVLPLPYVQAATELARRKGLARHLDGGTVRQHALRGLGVRVPRADHDPREPAAVP